MDVHLLACPFASGMERRAARHFSWTRAVVGPCQPLKSIVALGHGRYDLFVQLGGDLLFGRIASALNRSPLACYAYGPKRGLNRCDLSATAFPNMASTMTPSTLSLGDLVSDGLTLDLKAPTPWLPGGRRLLILPGSRPAIREAVRAYVGRTVRALRPRRDLQVVSLLPPFVDDQEKRLWLRSGVRPFSGGTRAALAGADLAVTQPGTNTLELMHAGIPSLVVVPFEFLRRIPLSGLKGWLLSFPGGVALKESLLRRAAGRRGYLAWPNRLASQEIMPELVGDVSPVDLAHRIDVLLDDQRWLNWQRRTLQAMSDASAPSPSSRLCDELERLVGIRT